MTEKWFTGTLSKNVTKRLHKVQKSNFSHHGRTPSCLQSHFVKQSFLEVHILTTTYQKAFILGPLVPSRVSFLTITSDPWVHAAGRLGGGGLEVAI